MDLRKKAIEYVLTQASSENIGVYPESVSGGDKPYEKRTDWMEGWNACINKFLDYKVQAQEWMENVAVEIKPLLETLLVDEKVSLQFGKGVRLYINCSDTFFWGCDDVEEITFKELNDLVECYQLSPKAGGDLWCAMKRRERPQGACYKDRYPRSDWHLFDACGPPRKKCLNNPVDREMLI